MHERNKAKIEARWDHAFYKGKYYMYFGVVPVIVFMVPLKLIGITIIGPQVTEICAGLTIIGIFLLFYEMAKKLCPKMPISVYLSACSAVSGISLWFAIKYPALYCTAIVSGVAFSIWGFYFCFKAFIVDEKKSKVIRDAVLGALCSSLVFGCRPTIGFISLAYIPMIWYYLNKNIDEKLKIKEWLKKVVNKDNIQVAIAFCLPYIIVAILLMTYNYIRFENPFEFGQSYQMTAFDQHNYMAGNGVTLTKIINAFQRHFIYTDDLPDTFPYLTYYGVFVNFPILLMIFYNFNFFNRKEEKPKVRGLAGALLITVIVITLFQVAWAPTIETRYSLDFNFVLGILLFLAFCKLINNAEEKNQRKVAFKITILATITVITVFLLFFVAFDSALVELKPELLTTVKTFLMLK